MATTLAVAAVRNALATALALRGGLAGVQVEYAWPGEAMAREVIFTGDARGTAPIAGLRAARKSRNEDTTFKVVVRVESPGATQYTADTRALTLGKEVEDLLADNPAALVAAGAHEAWIDGYELAGGITPDGRVAELTYTVAYRARLT